MILLLCCPYVAEKNAKREAGGTLLTMASVSGRNCLPQSLSASSNTTMVKVVMSTHLERTKSVRRDGVDTMQPGGEAFRDFLRAHVDVEVVKDEPP